MSRDLIIPDHIGLPNNYLDIKGDESRSPRIIDDFTSQGSVQIIKKNAPDHYVTVGTRNSANTKQIEESCKEEDGSDQNS